MLYRIAVPALTLLAIASVPAAAQTKVAPAAKMAAACEKLIIEVNKKVDPEVLPIKVLTQARTKVGPYTPNNPQKKLGGVKVTTVLTGTLEFQAGTSRRLAPFICMGTEKEAGFYYASRERKDYEDRPIQPVMDCYATYAGAGEQASACIRDVLTKIDQQLSETLAAHKAKLTPGTDDFKNFEASQSEFEAYRNRSCGVFLAPDASTDAADFYNACLARVNQLRVNKLNAPPPPPAPPTKPTED